MGWLDKLEAALSEALNKNAPLTMPHGASKALAGAMWWLALIAGAMQLYFAWGLWDLWYRAEQFVDLVNRYAEHQITFYGNDLGLSFYLPLAVMVASGVLLLLAVPGLKVKRKAGWNLAFYSLLLHVAYVVIIAFTKYGDGGNLLVALLWPLVGAYLLFQVRDRFVKADKTVRKA